VFTTKITFTTIITSCFTEQDQLVEIE